MPRHQISIKYDRNQIYLLSAISNTCSMKCSHSQVSRSLSVINSEGSASYKIQKHQTMDQNLLNYYYIRVVANIFFCLLHLMNDCCQLPETATGTIRSILPIYVQKQFIAQGSSNAQVSILYLILLSFHYCLSSPSFWVDC